MVLRAAGTERRAIGDASGRHACRRKTESNALIGRSCFRAPRWLSAGTIGFPPSSAGDGIEWAGVDNRRSTKPHSNSGSARRVRTRSPEGMNRYLFTTPGIMSQLELTVISRSLVLLVVSGITLTIGLALLYFPTLRHPAWLFAAGLVTATAGSLAPDWAILFAQAAVGGVLLTILAVVVASIARVGHASVKRGTRSHEVLGLEDPQE